MITVYGIKNCDSVKKALVFFKEHALDYRFVDFKLSPVQIAKIDQWCKLSDLSILLNTKGTTYRTLNLKDLSLSHNDKVEWMAKDNRLIKRPVIEYNANLIVGFNLSHYEGIFLP